MFGDRIEKESLKMKKANKQHVETLSQFFQVLSDQTRLRLLQTLQEGEQHVTELCKKLRLPQPTVSHHLGLLRMNGLVTNRRKGKLVFYSVNEDYFAEAGQAVRAFLKV